MTSPSQAQHARMHMLWHAAGITDRADRLALTAAFVGRQLTTSKDITDDEARRLIRYMEHLDDTGLLARETTAFLIRHRRPAPVSPPTYVDDDQGLALFGADPVPARRRQEWDL